MAPQPRMAIWVDMRVNFVTVDQKDVAILRDHLRLQRFRGLSAPDRDALRNHAHRVDDLRVARHGLRLQVRAGREDVRASEGFRRCPLIDEGYDQQHQAGSRDDEPQIGMNQEDREKIDGADRRIEQHQQHGSGHEIADELQVGEGLELGGGAVLCGFRRGCEDGAAERGFDLDGGSHQHDASDGIEKHVRQDRADHDDRQHDERIEAAARQDAIRQVEEINRNGKDQNVDDEREDADDDEVLAHHGHAPGQGFAKVLRAGAPLNGRPGPVAATAARRRRLVSGWFPLAAGLRGMVEIRRRRKLALRDDDWAVGCQEGRAHVGALGSRL